MRFPKKKFTVYIFITCCVKHITFCGVDKNAIIKQEKIVINSFFFHFFNTL